jgi:hypothetical protein
VPINAFSENEFFIMTNVSSERMKNYYRYHWKYTTQYEWYQLMLKNEALSQKSLPEDFKSVYIKSSEAFLKPYYDNVESIQPKPTKVIKNPNSIYAR